MKMVFLVLLLTFVISMGVFADEKKYIELKDIVYNKAGDIELKMDMRTLDDGKKNKPVVIAIYGGGWEAGSKVNGMGIAGDIVDWGYTVFAPDYRLTGVASFPAQIEDCKAAVRYIRANAKKYNINPKKIASYGHSAGGHLASLLGVLPQGKFEGKGYNLKTSSAVQAAISYVGPEDFSYYYTLKEPNPVRDNNFKQLFARNPEGMDYWIKAASPITYASKKSAPHLVMYGSIDDLVPCGQGAPFQKKMLDNKAYCEFYIEEGAWHILTPEFINPKMKAFLKKFLGN